MASLAALLGLSVAATAGWLGGGPPALDLPPVKAAWREAAAVIAAQAGPTDAVLCHDLAGALPLGLCLAPRRAGYARLITGFDARVFPWWGAPEDPAAALRRARRVWFVSSPLSWHESPATPAWAADRLATAGRLTRRIDVPGIRIECWVR